MLYLNIYLLISKIPKIGKKLKFINDIPGTLNPLILEAPISTANWLSVVFVRLYICNHVSYNEQECDIFPKLPSPVYSFEHDTDFAAAVIISLKHKYVKDEILSSTL